SWENGAGPMWCHGNTCIVNAGGRTLATGTERRHDVVPYNNVRWSLHRYGPDGWREVYRDDTGRTREPCPIAAYSDGRVFVSDNPTLTGPTEQAGPAQPVVWFFEPGREGQPARKLLPQWEGEPRFTEHSYRSFAADGVHHELI